MILPTKRLGSDRCLLYLGGELIELLDEPKTVSRLWRDMQARRSEQAENRALSFDWFVLSLDFLFALDAIDLKAGRIERKAK